MKLCEICGEQKPDSHCMTACLECRTEVGADHRKALSDLDDLRAVVEAADAFSAAYGSNAPCEEVTRLQRAYDAARAKLGGKL